MEWKEGIDCYNTSGLKLDIIPAWLRRRMVVDDTQIMGMLALSVYEWN